jgi:uncharacterized protein with NAD-binding domain and iron-sulfur cluster
MERQFNLFFVRPENYFGLSIEVPEDWDEWEENDRLYFLEQYVLDNGLRELEVEEYDES